MSLEKPQSNFVPLTGSVKRLRQFKAESQDVGVRGEAGHQLDEILDETDDVLTQLRVEATHWIEKMKEEFVDYFKKTEDTKIEGAYMTGVKRLVIKYARHQKKQGHSNMPPSMDAILLTDLIRAYTAEFILSLRSSRKFKTEPSQALKIAMLAYQLDAHAQQKLQVAFPNFEPGLIRLAATGHSTNPAAFLEKVQKTIPELTEKFPEFEPNVILQAAVSYPTNPKNFLENAQTVIRDLTKQFPDVEPWIIRHIATHSITDPLAFIEKLQIVIPDLAKQFPDIALSTIRTIAVKFPTDPKAYLEKIAKNK